MLKYFKFLPISILMVGCSTPRDYRQMTGQVAEYGVQSIQDKDKGVTCYVYRDGDWSSLSCVKTK